MRARAKSSNTPYPIWIQGEYITNPPGRPDGTVRLEGNYIDKGGYPGANVYAVDMETFCIQTAAVDRCGREIYTRDIVLCEAGDEIGYFLIEDKETAVDVLWGEIVRLECLQTENIKVIGNLIDNPDFVEGIRHYVENDVEIPYLPLLDVQMSAHPYFLLQCDKCKNKSLSCKYVARCRKCGRFINVNYSTQKSRKKEFV